MIPIHAIPVQHDEEPEPALPEDRLCYLVASNGLFKQVHNAFYSARVKVDGAGHLAAIDETAKVNVPKLPLKFLRQAEAFFCAIFEKYESEAVVLLQVNSATQTWRIEVPPQIAQGLRVRYDLSALPQTDTGFERFGTIHSHANIKAFHSGTDDEDETTFDGLHITIGNVDKPVRTYSARWMLAGREFKVELEDVVEGAAPAIFDSAWLECVQHGITSNSALSEMQPRESIECHLSDHGSLFPIENEGFPTLEAYEGYLLAVRDEIDERLLEAGAQSEISTQEKET